MNRTERYEAQLEELTSLLHMRRVWTAHALAKHMRCTKPTVYARLAALKRRGVVILSSTTRAGTRGPRARAYYL